MLVVSGGVSQRREVIPAQSHLQRQARRGCVPVHHPQAARGDRQLQGSRASRRSHKLRDTVSCCATAIGYFTSSAFPSVAVADIPGIIRGAHLNRGLGLSFLRHIERCRFLLFVLDMSSPDPWVQLEHLRYELDRYEPDLSQRPRAIVANKMDLPDSRSKLEALRSLVAGRVIPVSALTGQNTEELILHLRESYDGHLQGEASRDGKSTGR